MKRVPITLVVEVEEWDGHFERAPSYTAQLLASWVTRRTGDKVAVHVGNTTAHCADPDEAIRQALASLNPQKLVPT